jgi:hypothetical protein
MSLIRLNLNPSARDLRVFSVLWLVFLGGFGAIAWHRGATNAALVWWLVAVAVAVPGMILPRLVRLVYLAATYAAWPVGYVVSTVILAAFYFLVLLPVGVIMRGLGRDPLDRRFDPKRTSYWEARGPAPSASSYFRQYP